MSVVMSNNLTISVMAHRNQYIAAEVISQGLLVRYQLRSKVNQMMHMCEHESVVFIVPSLHTKASNAYGGIYAARTGYLQHEIKALSSSPIALNSSLTTL